MTRTMSELFGSYGPTRDDGTTSRLTANIQLILRFER